MGKWLRSSNAISKGHYFSPKTVERWGPRQLLRLWIASRSCFGLSKRFVISLFFFFLFSSCLVRDGIHVTGSLQSKDGGDKAEEGGRGAGQSSGTTVRVGILLVVLRAIGLGAGRAGRGLAGALLVLVLVTGRVGGGGGTRGLSAAVAAVVVVAASGTGGLGSALGGDVVVLGDAALLAVGVALGLLGGAVTLVALGEAGVGVVDLVLVGGGDSNAAGLANNVAIRALVDTGKNGRLGGVQGRGHRGGIALGGRAGLGSGDSGENANGSNGETHLDRRKGG
jgi:hypothetical protein